MTCPWDRQLPGVWECCRCGREVINCSAKPPLPCEGVEVYSLPSDEAPRFVGVDYGRDGGTTECEVEYLDDGTIKVLDIRHTPAVAQ